MQIVTKNLKFASYLKKKNADFQQPSSANQSFKSVF